MKEKTHTYWDGRENSYILGWKRKLIHTGMKEKTHTYGDERENSLNKF